MNPPSFVYEPVIDKNGYLTPSWQYFFNQLINELQLNFNENVLVMPTQDATTLSQLTNLQNGSMTYDSTNNLAKIVIAGIYKTILTA